MVSFFLNCNNVYLSAVTGSTYAYISGSHMRTYPCCAAVKGTNIYSMIQHRGPRVTGSICAYISLLCCSQGPRAKWDEGKKRWWYGRAYTCPLWCRSAYTCPEDYHDVELQVRELSSMHKQSSLDGTRTRLMLRLTREAKTSSESFDVTP